MLALFTRWREARRANGIINMLQSVRDFSWFHPKYIFLIKFHKSSQGDRGEKGVTGYSLA